VSKSYDKEEREKKCFILKKKNYDFLRKLCDSYIIIHKVFVWSIDNEIDVFLITWSKVPWTKTWGNDWNVNIKVYILMLHE
jgi:hypothetical protein